MIGIGIAIGALLYITKGSISQGSFLAILIFLLVAVIVPPAGLIVGLAVIIGLLYQANAPVAIANYLSNVTGAGPTTAATPSGGPAAFAPAQGPLVVTAPPKGGTA